MKRLLLLLLSLPAFAQQVTVTGGVATSGSLASTQSAFAITTAQLPSGTYGTVYSPTVIQTANGTAPVTCTFLSNGLDLPTGMTFTNSTCTLSGTPTQVGTFTFHFQATDAANRTAIAFLHFSVFCPPLQLTSPVSLPPSDNGTAWQYQFQTLGGILPLTFSGSSFPTGVSVNASTGLASGTPTVTGNFTPTVSVTDSCPTPQSVSGTFAQTVNGTLAVTTTTVPSGTVGSSFTTQLASAGGTPAITWSVDSLPTGLSLNTSTGVVSGTPTAVQTISSTFTATDSLLATATKTFSISTSCAAIVLNTTTLPNGTQNIAYQSGVSVTGGDGTLTYSATDLPTGLSINSTTGLISGTPTVAGTFSPTLTITDSCPTAQTLTAQLSLTISQSVPPLAINTASLPSATESISYGPISMTATGGTAPYTWSLAAGSFPAGISMTSAGVISGTPTTAGTSNPDIQVTDNAASTTHSVFPITVSCNNLSVTTSALPSGTQGTAYSFGSSFSGGTGTVSWSATGLPTGLSISSVTGLISGTPSVNGTFSIGLTATDSCSPTPQSSLRTLSLQINSATLAITTSTLPNGTVNQNYSVTLSGVGGTAPYTWSSTTLPTGLSLAASTGVISGTPTVAATSSITVTLTDNAAHSVQATYSLVINPVTAADNAYCTPSGTWLGSTTDGPAALPTRCYYTAMSGTPSPGTVHTAVPISSLSSAYSSAACGDTILITAGTTATGPISLAAKNCDSQHYITIESTGVSNANFPSEGTRFTPCWSGISSLPNRPAYPCPTPTVLTAQLVAPKSSNALILNGADHIRFIGLEFTRVTTPAIPIYIIVDLTSHTSVQTNHIIFDRCWVHGVNADGTFPQTSATDTSTTRGIYLAQSNTIAVIDSYFSDFYDNGSTASNGNTDAQAIAGGVGGIANSGWGIYKFVNNHLEGGSETILLGGSGGPPLTPSGCTFGSTCNDDVPTDVEVRRNYLFKSQGWFGNGSSAGWPNVKNGIEFKTGARILLEGNIMENCWYNSQPYCYVFDFAPKNQSAGGNPSCPSCLVEDFTARYNYGYHYPGPAIAVYSTMDSGCSACTTLGRRGSVHDNLVGDNLNTAWGTNVGTGWDCAEFLADAGPMTSITISHNTCVNSKRSWLLYDSPNATNFNNITIQNNLSNLGSYAAVTSGKCTLNTNTFYANLQACFNTYTVDHNAGFNWCTTCIGSTLGRGWPTNNSGLGSWFFTSPTASGTYLNSAGSLVTGTVGFTNYSTDSGFNPSAYILSNTSPLHNAGSDGKDIGADINTLQTKIAGVRQ